MSKVGPLGCADAALSCCSSLFIADHGFELLMMFYVVCKLRMFFITILGEIL